MCNVSLLILYPFQALLPKAVMEQFESRKMSMNDSSMVVRLYYCGLLERPNRADEILKNGFSEEGTFLTFRYCLQWVFPIVNIFWISTKHSLVRSRRNIKLIANH